MSPIKYISKQVEGVSYNHTLREITKYNHMYGFTCNFLCIASINVYSADIRLQNRTSVKYKTDCPEFKETIRVPFKASVTF